MAIMSTRSTTNLSRDRGIVRASDNSVKQHCTISYLHTLYLELCRVRAFVLSSISSIPNIQDQHQRIQFLEHEFNRLSRYPSLFPSITVKHRFLMLCFHSDCEYHFSKSMGDLLIGKEVARIKDESRTQLTHPTYVPGSYGWENFLLPGAPGIPLNAKETEPRSAFQVLPGAGMRICSDFSREENDIIQFVHAQTNTLSAAEDLKNLPFDYSINKPQSQLKAAAKNSGIQLRHHTQNIIMTPSPFREDLGLRLDIRGITTGSVENYSSIIYRIEQQGPGHNAPAAALNAPNMFAVMGIRSWHKPLHRWDLHYHSAQFPKCECQQGDGQAIPA